MHGPVHALPADEQELLRPWGVGSYLVVPIFVDGELRGYLCLEDGDDDRYWSVTELEALRTASRTFAASIRRYDSDQALAESEARYRDLLENASDLIQSVSPDGRFRFVNRAWKETLGYGETEVEGLRVWDVARGGAGMEGDAEGTDRDVVQSILADDGQGRFEAVFITKDGQEIPVEGSVNCRYEDGLPVADPRHFPRHHRAQSLRPHDPGVHLHRQPRAAHAVDFHHRLLGFARQRPASGSQSGSASWSPLPCATATGCCSSSTTCWTCKNSPPRNWSSAWKRWRWSLCWWKWPRGIRGFAESFGIRLQLAPVPSDLTLQGDFDRLLQVLDNLLSNAIKFSPKGEEVWMRAAFDDTTVTLTVEDRGPGIPEEFRSRLFDRFTQFDSSATRRSGGSGLGLSIVKGLVEGMQGSIQLDTEVGRGTAFHLHLPRWPGEGEED